MTRQEEAAFMESPKGRVELSLVDVEQAVDDLAIHLKPSSVVSNEEMINLLRISKKLMKIIGSVRLCK